jgi:hypothetical protein
LDLKLGIEPKAGNFSLGREGEGGRETEIEDRDIEGKDIEIEGRNKETELKIKIPSKAG